MEENKENPLKGRGPSDLLPEKGNPFSKRKRTKSPASESSAVAPTATIEDELPEMTADDVEMLFGDADDEYFEMLAPIDLTPADLDVYFGRDDDDSAPDFVASDPDIPQEMTPEAVEAFFAEQEFEPDLTTDLLETPVDLTPEQLAALFDDAAPQGDIMTNDDNTPDLTPDMVEAIFGSDSAEDAPEGMVAIENPMSADAEDPTGYHPVGMIDDIPADIPVDEPMFGRPPIDAPVDLPGTSPSLPRMDAFEFDDTAVSSEDPTPTGQLPPRGLPPTEDEPQFGSGPSTNSFEQTYDTPTFGTFAGSLPTAGERLAGSGGPSTPSRAPRVNTYEVITPDRDDSHADRPISPREPTTTPTLLLGPGTLGNLDMPPAVVELPEMLELLVTEERVEELWERIDRVEERVIEEMAPTMPNRDLYLDRLRSARNLLLGGKAYYDDARRQLSDVENRVAFIPRMQSWSQTVATRLFFFQLICLLLLVVFASVIPFISPFLTFADLTETFIRILLWTISAGGAGGVLASLWSLRVHVTEKQDFDRQHELWYILTPVKGMLLGLFVFLASASNIVVPFQEENMPSRFAVIAVALALGFQQNVAFDLIARVISVLKPEKK